MGLAEAFTIRLAQSQWKALTPTLKGATIRYWIERGSGPVAKGELGPGFSIRLTMGQYARLMATKRKTGERRGSIVRRWISEGVK